MLELESHSLAPFPCFFSLANLSNYLWGQKIYGIYIYTIYDIYDTGKYKLGRQFWSSSATEGYFSLKIHIVSTMPGWLPKAISVSPVFPLPLCSLLPLPSHSSSLLSLVTHVHTLYKSSILFIFIHVLSSISFSYVIESGNFRIRQERDFILPLLLSSCVTKNEFLFQD